MYRSDEEKTRMYREMSRQLNVMSGMCSEMMHEASEHYKNNDGYIKSLSDGAIDKNLSVLQSSILRMRKKIKGDI